MQHYKDKIFTPANKYQNEFLNDWDTQFIIAQGGRQTGKSITGCIKSILYMSTHANTMGRIIAPTYVDLDDVNLPMFLEWCPKSIIAKYDQVRRRIELTNGSKVVFRSANDKERFGRGRTDDWFWWDEPTYTRRGYEIWQMYYPALIVRNGRGWFTSTPKGRDWFYKSIRTKAEKGDEHYKLLTFTTYDNPYANKEMIDEAKSTMSDIMFKQEILGEVVDFQGLIYPDWNERTMTYSDEKSWGDARLFVSVDVGFNNPTCALFAYKTPDGVIWVDEELYITNQTTDSIKLAITEMCRGRKVEMFLIDPSSANVVQSSATSVLSLLRADPLGIPFVKARNDVMGGIQNMTRYINGDKLRINKRCVNLLRELEGYVWDSKPRDVTQREAPIKEDDHACFIAGTKVLTPNGSINIEDLRAGMEVTTPYGSERVVTISTPHCDVYDFGMFTSTSNHPVLSSRGIVRVDGLRYDDYIWKGRQKQYTFWEYLIGGILTQDAGVRGFILGGLLTRSLEARLGIYTVKYGSTIEEVYLQDILSITKEANRTIQLRTLNYLLVNSTPHGIGGEFGRVALSIYHQLELLLKRGTAQRKVGDGTLSILSKGGLREYPLLNDVVCAIESTVQSALQPVGFVVDDVKPQHFADVEVYNLATPSGMYFANNVLVSNCDACRYLLMQQPDLWEDVKRDQWTNEIVNDSDSFDRVGDSDVIVSL